ncbi:MAG: dipeptidase [Bryobacterales bacterium]|nr:dipeptidase [Bryobacterales bacterium]
MLTRLLLAALFLAQPAQEPHFRALVVDGHVDTPQRLFFDRSFDFGRRGESGHVDLPRLREGGLDAAFFSIWAPGEVTGPAAVRRSLQLMDAVIETVRRHPRDLVLATTAAAVRQAHRAGRIAVLMGVEGGHLIDDDLAVLRCYAALGARYLTLTHSSNNNWADSSTDKPRHNGLTAFGRDVVKELNRLGVMVDVSHVSDKTFADVLEISTAPVIASHSSCRELCGHPRNMSDAMLRALAKNGGVVMINYNAGFLSEEFRKASAALKPSLYAPMLKVCGPNPYCRIEGYERLERQWMKEGRLPAVSWERIVDHVDHAARVAGVDHVGLGSDFDGATMPLGMEDAARLPRLTEALRQKGYSEADIAKILGGNLLRVMEQVERRGILLEK